MRLVNSGWSLIPFMAVAKCHYCEATFECHEEDGDIDCYMTTFKHVSMTTFQCSAKCPACNTAVTVPGVPRIVAERIFLKKECPKVPF